MISLRTFTIAIMLLFMMFQSLMFGASDIWSLILLVITTAIIFNVAIKLQIGNKRALRANAKEDGFLYNFLSNDKTIFIKVASFIVSFVLAMLLTLILKGIIINHGYWALFIIIAGVSFTIFSFLNNENTTSKTITDNLQADIAGHANVMLHIVLVALSLNFVLSLLLSAHDTMALLNSHITFENFDQYAVKDAVEKTNGNHYTRLMINLYVLLDYFKLAITTKIIYIVIPDMQDKVSWFYLFYAILFFLNMMKLFAFSLSFVLMQKGMESFTKRGLIISNKTIINIKTKIDARKSISEPKQEAEEANETIT